MLDRNRMVDQKRLDPDVMTALNLALTALGAVCGLGTLIQGMRSHYRRVEEKRKREDTREIYGEFLDKHLAAVCLSAENIQRQLSNMLTIIQSEDDHYLSNSAQYGGKPLYMSRSGHDSFMRSVNRLLQELGNVIEHIDEIYIFISQYPEWCAGDQASKLSGIIRKIIHRVRAISEDPPKTYMEYFTRLQRIAELVESMERFAGQGLVMT